MKKISLFILAVCMSVLLPVGCGETEGSLASDMPDVHNPVGAKQTPQEAALTAYIALLSGDRTLLDDEQLKTWWIPDFQEDGMEYEYTCLDLDGDSVPELIVQMLDDPCGYNAVFHFAGGRLFCWNSDSAEMNCRDYPLNDGTMVRQYDYSGTCTWTVFRYLENGETEEIFSLFAWEEQILEDGSEPCPYYETEGEEVDKAVFDERLKELVTDRMLERESWKPV